MNSRAQFGEPSMIDQLHYFYPFYPLSASPLGWVCSFGFYWRTRNSDRRGKNAWLAITGKKATARDEPGGFVTSSTLSLSARARLGGILAQHPTFSPRFSQSRPGLVNRSRANDSGLGRCVKANSPESERVAGPCSEAA